jgi:hypothetical protein
MVESPRALSKFAVKNTVYDEELDTDFFFNPETITRYNNLDTIIELAPKNRSVHGVVFGRVDITGLLGQTGRTINTPEITRYVTTVAEKDKQAGLDLLLGGAISSDTLDTIREVATMHLTRFETRVRAASSLDKVPDGPLEHLVDPVALVKEIRAAVADDGFFYAEVPLDRPKVRQWHAGAPYRRFLDLISATRDSWIAADFAAGVARNFGRTVPRLEAVKQSEHINYFSTQSLQAS